MELAEARAALGRAEAQAAAAEAARSQASERLRDQEVQALTEQLHKMILSTRSRSERQRRSVFSPGL